MSPHKANEIAPPTPACFPDRVTWVGYLIDCQGQGRGASTRPFDGGKYRPKFSFCTDCTAPHASAMARAGKCSPNQFHVVVIEEAAA